MPGDSTEATYQQNSKMNAFEAHEKRISEMEQEHLEMAVAVKASKRKEYKHPTPRLPELRHADQIADAVNFCQPIEGEPGRVFVPSRSSKTPYLVDCDEYDGTGRCGCRDFECNHEPYLSGKYAAEGYSPKRRCFHIQTAVEYLHLMDARRRNGTA